MKNQSTKETKIDPSVFDLSNRALSALIKYGVLNKDKAREKLDSNINHFKLLNGVGDKTNKDILKWVYDENYLKQSDSKVNIIDEMFYGDFHDCALSSDVYSKKDFLKEDISSCDFHFTSRVESKPVTIRWCSNSEMWSVYDPHLIKWRVIAHNTAIFHLEQSEIIDNGFKVTQDPIDKIVIDCCDEAYSTVIDLMFNLVATNKRANRKHLSALRVVTNDYFKINTNKRLSQHKDS